MTHPNSQTSQTPRSLALKMAAFGLAFGIFFVAGNYVSKAIIGRVQGGTLSNAELNKLASELNKQLPMMLDQETQLRTSIAVDGRLRYIYKLTRMSADSIDKPKLREFIAKQATAMSCTNPDTRKLIDRNVDLEYWYEDRLDRFVFSYILKKKACEPYPH